MPATTTTTELFSKALVTPADVQNEQRLRIKAGAIRSSIDGSDPTNFVLKTEWNVIGENDDVLPSDGTIVMTVPAPASAALTVGQGYVAASPSQWLGQSVGTGQCVAYVQTASGAPLTSAWQRGARAKGNLFLASGSAIATFDANGTYGNHTNGTSHAAIFLAQDSTGLAVYDQWLGQPVHHRIIRFGGSPEVNDGNEFFVIS